MWITIAVLLGGCSSLGDAPRVGDSNPWLNRIQPGGDVVAYMGTAVEGTGNGLYLGDVSGYRAVVPGRVLSFGWFPDGSRLLVLVRGDLDEDHERFLIVNDDGTIESEFTPSEPLDGQFGYLAVSLDESRAVWAATIRDRPAAQLDLYLVEIPSGEVSQLTKTDSNENHPQFISDRMLAFLSDGLTVFDLETRETKTLSGPSQGVGSFDITSDGQFIVYNAVSDDDRATRVLWFVPTDGSSPPTELTSTPGLWMSLDGRGHRALVARVGELPGDLNHFEWVDLPQDLPWTSS